jgi:FAD/FMN-containing dehydrogenase
LRVRPCDPKKSMRRRALFGTGLSLAAAALLPAREARAEEMSRVRPGQPGWPSVADWARLGEAVGGRLAPVATPDLSGPEARGLLANPFYLADQPALTECSGWLGAWRSSPSAYVVDARGATDVVAAVRFARAHNLRLVVKGRGHSFFGASCAPDSLLIWTRHMDQVTAHEAFTPQGSTAPAIPAVSCGGGAMWLHAYDAVTTKGGRFVQGGGCTTVGVAGLVQGGGFGTFSKAYGLAGASLVEAEVVTADGKVRVVNHTREPDLFWALKGGGGGTFGVVTRVTLATHALPETFSAVRLDLKARSDDAYRRLLGSFIETYAANLLNPHWGEQVFVGPDNVFRVRMVGQGLTGVEARAAWRPLIDFAAANPADYEGVHSFSAVTFPARLYWNTDVVKLTPGNVVLDQHPGAAPGDYWWSGDSVDAGAFVYAFTSAWLPARLLQPASQARFVDAWFAASRQLGFQLQFSKGLAGATDDVIAAARDTPMNPDALEAFAMALIGDLGPSLFAGAQPDVTAARASATRVQAAMKALRVAAPDTGAYAYECDYFQPDWRRAFWGDHYPRLLRVKRRYDPTGLFTVHHGVGSEAWSADGFTRLT